MSWFFKALQSEDSDSDSSAPLHTPVDQAPTPTSSVKDDLSLFSQTLGRQIRGVASFLAPPPQSAAATAGDVVSADSSDSSSLSSDALLGIRKDLVEIGGSLRTGFSLLSTNSNKAVGEISRLATNFLQFPDEPTEEEEEDEDESTGDVPGVTEEVLDFVTEMTSRPQFWTDFPLAVDYTDFTLSDVQKLHISAVEQLAPSLSALRVELQSSMSEERFWIIYFIMLLPRLDEHDFELLATPEIVEAREILMQKLQNKNNTQMDPDSNETSNLSEKDIEVTEMPDQNRPWQEKMNMTEAVRAAGSSGIHEEENPEKWLEEADIDTETSADGGKIFEHEEDVSFSDLEDDENDLSTRFSENRQGRDNKPSSPNESSDWVQLNEGSETKGVQQKTGQSKEKDSEGEESNDWLTVDDF